MCRFIEGATRVLVLLAAAGSAWAHHPPKLERCQAVTLEGELRSIEWSNPHVQLVVAAEDGTSHTFSWLNLQQLRLAGIERDSLRVGDRLSVTGTRQARSTARSVLLQEIRRVADGWAWSQPPQGCT